MPKRAYFSAFLVFLAMLLLVGMATYAQADFHDDAPALLQAQRQSPALWLLDVGIIGFPAIVFGFSVILIGLQKQSQQQETFHREQLGAMLGRATELETQNGVLEERVAERLAAVTARQTTFETEARTQIMQAAEALQDELSQVSTALQTDVAASIEAMQEPLTRQARQIEDIHMAIQYQGAELQQMRHGLRTPQMASPIRVSALSADEMAALQEVHVNPAITASASDYEPVPTDGSSLTTLDETELEAFAAAPALACDYATPQTDGLDVTGNAETTLVLAIQEYDLAAFASDDDDLDNLDDAPPAEMSPPVLTLQSVSTPERVPAQETETPAESPPVPMPQTSPLTSPALPTEWRLKL